MSAVATIHASAVLVGARALLIRGPSGSGKSQLAWHLIERAPFARLIGDDRVFVEAMNGRVIVRAADALRGLIEIRGLGIRQVPHETRAVLGLVVDLAAPDAERLPAGTGTAEIAGLALARLAVAPGTDPIPMVEAFLHTPPGGEVVPEPSGQDAESGRAGPVYRNTTAHGL